MIIPKYQIFGKIDDMLSFIRENTKEDSKLFVLSGIKDDDRCYIAIAPSEKSIQDNLSLYTGALESYNIKEITHELGSRIF